ncbi:MAG: NAD(P)H-binding protein [Solirubrobacteraceae bacterium]
MGSISVAERPRVLVTGASGQLGGLTARCLLGSDASRRPVLMSRTPDRLAGLAEAGAELRFGDFDQPASLVRAFTGIDRLLVISTPDLLRRTEQHRSAIRVAAEVGVRHVIYTSCLRPEATNPGLIASSHAATESFLRESGLSWTICRESLYSEYQVAEAGQAVATGALAHNRGEGRIAYVSRANCAAVAAAILAGGGHDGEIHDVTGPDSFTASELAALYGELSGRQIGAVALDDEAFGETIRASGVEDEHARLGVQLAVSLGRSVREGYMASRTDVVERLTASAPTTLRSTLEADMSWAYAGVGARGARSA